MVSTTACKSGHDLMGKPSLLRAFLHPCSQDALRVAIAIGWSEGESGYGGTDGMPLSP